VAALALALLVAGCAPQSVTTQGDAARFAYNFFLWTAAGVFVLVSGLVVWSVIRYRRRDDELPKQIHGSNKLELTWTILPFILVLILFAVTLSAQNKVLHRSAAPGVTIKVTAFQWSWQFDYERSGAQVIGEPKAPPTMVVPVGEPIRIRLVSADVVHAFYIPKTLFKRQAIPGTVNLFDLTFDQTGTFHGQCTVFCGLDHTDMQFDVRVVSQSEFQSWLQSAKKAPTGA
jgi:cytochrome c oxidase subunit II